MSVTPDDLARITTDVWRDILGAEAEPAPPTAVAGDLTGCIRIEGCFRGAAVLMVPRAVARAAAAAMFARPEPGLTAEDERDAIGELTNMIGGHIKSMVASPSTLELPNVVVGSAHCLQRCNLQPIAEQAMIVPGGTVVVQVLEDVG